MFGGRENENLGSEMSEEEEDGNYTEEEEEEEEEMGVFEISELGRTGGLCSI